MTQAHALLQAAWESGDDASVLLVLADWLEEHDYADTAEVIRLAVAEAGTARHSPGRAARLKELRDGSWKRIKETPWPEMAVQGNHGAVGFSRRLGPGRPGRECVVVRPDRRTAHWVTVAVDGDDEVVSTRGGREVLRRRLPDHLLACLRAGRDLNWGPAFAVGEAYFPLPDGWQADPGPALAERRLRVEAALAPAAILLPDLPAELVPYVARVLCEYASDKGRRARGGHVVPGAHVLLYFAGPGAWRHEAAVTNRDAGKATALLRERFRMRALHGIPRSADDPVLAGLLVRVSDGGRVTGRKLVWLGLQREVRETANLPSADATLTGEDFRRALAGVAEGVGGDVSRLAETFVADTATKLRALFNRPKGAGGEF